MAGEVVLTPVIDVVKQAGTLVFDLGGSAVTFVTGNPILMIGFGVTLVLGICGFVFNKMKGR